MSRPNLSRHQPGSEPSGFDVLEAQRAVDRRISEIYKFAPWLDGHLLAVETDSTTGRPSVGISLLAGVPKRLVHRLGRPYRGGFVVRDFGGSPSQVLETDSDAVSVTLVSLTDCKIFFWAW